MGAGSGGGTSEVEQRKRRSDGTGSATQARGAQGDVFDQLGNTGVLAQVQAREVEAEETSLLGLAEAETEPSSLTRGQLESAAAEEEAARRAASSLDVQDSPEQAEAVAAQTGVDPVLLTSPTDLGSSEQAKQKAMGAEGKEAISRAIDEAALSLGAVKLDDTAKDIVTERIEDNLSVEDIVNARRDGSLDELVHEALRADAIRSRDEVDFLLQQLAQDQRAMGELLAGGSPDAIAIGMIEHLAVELVEIEDLLALAAYDHGDMLKKLVLEDEAVNVHRRLSPLALRMGGFSGVFYQLVVDEIERHPLPVDPMADGQVGEAERGDPRLPAFRKNLMGLVTELRLFRTASAA